VSLSSVEAVIKRFFIYLSSDLFNQLKLHYL